MSKVIRTALPVLLIFILVVYIIGTLSALATNEQKMHQKFVLYADTSASGTPETEYPRLAQAIAGYLDGQLDTPQIEVQKQKGEADAFSERELLHLHDIRELVELSRLLRWVAIGLVVLMAGIYFYIRKKHPEFITASQVAKSVRIASGVLLAAIALIAIWGFIGFDGLFVGFHKLLFRNDLWLLDPETDLLLQLMPQPFFVSYAWDLLKQNAFLLLILVLALFGLRSGKGEAA